jgi:methylenetetrahydrofolate dehydrogenase (NADP+)/methenyltetrahydrofolate cyclohydrolase
MPAQILDGAALAKQMRVELAAQVAAFRAAGNPAPTLAAVLVGADPASQVYVRNKRRDCEEVGMQSRLHRLAADTTQTELLALIDQLNRDPGVHGILVQLPLPKQIDERAVLEAVSPAKDVDCFHPENVGRIVQGRPRFLPCTPYGVVEMLVDGGVPIAGAHVVVLGRSEIVGKPLALMLLQKGAHANATVTVCHSRTQNLVEITRTADILVAAIGVPEFVKREMVRPGAVVIDVGINRVDDATKEKGYRLCGDVEFEPVAAIASAITPVPGGVGPMTIAMLLKNTLQAAELTRAG